jgi:hypothetical protein
MSPAGTHVSNAQVTFETQYAFYLLRILKVKGAPNESEPDKWPAYGVRHGSTVIRRMIPTAGTGTPATSLVLRPSKLAIELFEGNGNTASKDKSFDIVPIENATTIKEAQDWLAQDGQAYLKNNVESHSIIRLACEWQQGV